MTFENDETPEAWVRIEMSHRTYLDFLATAERLMGALRTIGQFGGKIEPFVTDPTRDAETFLVFLETVDSGTVAIDKPAEPIIMVRWYLQHRCGSVDGVPLWEDETSGECASDAIDRIDPAVKPGRTYRIRIVTGSGSETILREFSV